jgi:hypothetical protein
MTQSEESHFGPDINAILIPAQNGKVGIGVAGNGVQMLL